MNNLAPVVIVGGGPVGMMLALNLDLLGVRTVIVNAEAAPRWHPKGSTHNSRTMEHFRRLGLSKQIRRLGLPYDHPTDVGYFTRLNGRELARIPMPSEMEKAAITATASATAQVVEPIARVNQMYVENFVFQTLKTRECVELRFGWRCVDWRETPDGVFVEIENSDGAKRETWKCSYLVGCDGGQSLSRRKLGIRYCGDGLEKQAYMGNTMVSSHIRAPELFKAIHHKKCWHYWIVNASFRSNLLSLNGDDEFLLLSQLPEGVDKPDDALIQSRFINSIGSNVNFELLGHWGWTPGHALVAEKYGSERVLLCGDAVHLFTPTGGFGLNTGVDDAANLAWKLAAVLHGWGGRRLIESYEMERRPIAIRNTRLAKSLTRNVGTVFVDAAIEDETPKGAAARREAGRILSMFTEEFASIGIQLGARYDDSPIIVSDGAAPPSDDPARYIPTSIPGGRSPHLWLSDRTSLYDHLGLGFTLLQFGNVGDKGRALQVAALKRRIPLKIVNVDVEGARDLYERDMVLTRPDQHVCWRGNIPPDDCEALLAQVTGN